MSNAEHPILSLPTCQPVRWVRLYVEILLLTTEPVAFVFCNYVLFIISFAVVGQFILHYFHY